jgi:hypothetical protein
MTRLTTYVDSAGGITRTVGGYHLRFHRDSHSDFRAFPSDQSRAEFINKNFTQLNMREIPLGERKSTSLPCPLEDVVGEYLSDVTFVMDYLQLRFCGAAFSFYNWPVVILANRRLEFGEPGYRDALCGLIAKAVQSIDVFLDTGLTFKFQGGETMTVSLRAPAGSNLPEVAEYSSGKKSGIIWTSGEEPFD